MESLKVRENGPMSWDFTLSQGPDMGDKGGRPVILNDPGMHGGEDRTNDLQNFFPNL